MKKVTQTSNAYGKNQVRVCTLVDGDLLFEEVVSKKEVASTKEMQLQAVHDAIEAYENHEAGMRSGEYGY